MSSTASGLDSFLGVSTVTEFAAKHGGGTISASGSITVVAGGGRNGGNCLRFADDGAAVAIPVPAAATGYVGAAIKLSSLTGAVSLVEFLDTTVTHVRVLITPAGEIRLDRGTTQVAISAAGVIGSGQFYYLEVKVTIADAGGVIEVLKNGGSVVSFSGDTRNAGNATFNTIRIRGAIPTQNTDWADLYYNQVGYWGDIRVELRKPTAEGNSAVWTPSAGTDNSANVDESTANDDTDYNSSGTPGDKDTFVMEDLVSTSGTVQAVQEVVRVRKDDAGARSIVTVARLSATEVDSAVVTVNTTYGYARDARTTKPGGGTWTISDVNSSEHGYKVNA